MKKFLLKIQADIARYSKKVVLPLFDGLTLYDVSVIFFKGIVEGRITDRAASIAFSFFLALFPGIIFLFNLIPYFPVQGIEDEVFNTFQRILPPDTYDATRSTIADILNNKRSDLLSLGFLLALIFATNGINALISNFNNTIHQIDSRGFFKQQLAAVSLTILLSFLFLIGLTLVIFSSTVLNGLLDFFHLDAIEPMLIETTRLLLMVSIVLLAIALLYNFGPAKTRAWRFISPGSILATLLIIISSFGFSYYVSNFAQYNKLYGSIGTLIIIMLWLYLNAMVLIVGFELNASIATVKSRHSQAELELDEE
jgi:membrane protein